MSTENNSASTAGHFTANKEWQNSTKTQLDGYLMMHANGSLPLVRRSSAKDIAAVEEWAENFNTYSRQYHIGITTVGFASGELSVSNEALYLRATNSLNGRDTIHEISISRDTSLESSDILPAVLVERITLPKGFATVSMLDMDFEERQPLACELADSSELALSVLRAAFLLCKFTAQA